jgi:hypothetical protein
MHEEDLIEYEVGGVWGASIITYRMMQIKNQKLALADTSPTAVSPSTTQRADIRLGSYTLSPHNR